MEPMVSVLWINYNSSSFTQCALESLKVVEELDYSNHELVIVDNGSNDNSFLAIKSFIERYLGNIEANNARVGG